MGLVGWNRIVNGMICGWVMWPSGWLGVSLEWNMYCKWVLTYFSFTLHGHDASSDHYFGAENARCNASDDRRSPQERVASECLRTILRH
jgi:hypothetical protein